MTRRANGCVIINAILPGADQRCHHQPWPYCPVGVTSFGSSSLRFYWSQLLTLLATIVAKAEWTRPANRRMPTGVIDLPINYHKEPFLTTSTGETQCKSRIIALRADALDGGQSTGEAIRHGPTCNGVGEARRQWRYNRSTWPPVAIAHRLTDCDDQATRRARPISAAIETYVAPCKQNASESFIASCLCDGAAP